MDRVTLWEARANLKGVLARVARTQAPVEIVRNVGDNAVILPARLWAEIEATMAAFDRPEDPLRLLARMAAFYAEQAEPQPGPAGRRADAQAPPAERDFAPAAPTDR